MVEHDSFTNNTDHYRRHQGLGPEVLWPEVLWS